MLLVLDFRILTTLSNTLCIYTYLRRQTSLRFLFNIHARSNNLKITQSSLIHPCPNNCLSFRHLLSLQIRCHLLNSVLIYVLPFMTRMHHLSEGTKRLHSGYYFTSTSALCIPATFQEVVYTSTNLLAQVLHFMTPFDMVWVQAVCVRERERERGREGERERDSGKERLMKA